MDTTPRFNLPYPEGHDPVAAGDTAIRGLAEAVEATLLTPASYDVSGNPGAHLYPSARSGWQMFGSFSLRTLGSLHMVSGAVQRTGPDLTVSATGDITDYALVDLIPMDGVTPTWMPIIPQALTSLAGRVHTSKIYTESGSGYARIESNAVAGSADIITGAVLSFAGFYLALLA